MVHDAMMSAKYAAFFLLKVVAFLESVDYELRNLG